MTVITLRNSDIQRALPLVSDGLVKYLAIQQLFRAADSIADPVFRKLFNGFYRVRRDEKWQKAFYRVLGRQKSARDGFAEVLDQLHRGTGRTEASFASKLVATVDPTSPVIDSIVLKNVGLRLRRTGSPSSRMEHAVEVHSALSEIFAEYLSTPAGKYLVRQFERRYPKSGLTPVKMLDLTLWKTRS